MIFGPNQGELGWLCSGALVLSIVFLTSGHCAVTMHTALTPSCAALARSVCQLLEAVA